MSKEKNENKEQLKDNTSKTKNSVLNTRKKSTHLLVNYSSQLNLFTIIKFDI